ncbi:MAG: chromate transporter [Clostridia bacterium]|nr:chromate transporter [Clostridia bacterium]
MNIFLDLFLTFFKIGAFTFGGGYAMLPLMQEEVLAHKWMPLEDVVNFIAVSESTPGPFAINMATYVGSEVGGAFGLIGSLFGSFCATFGVVLPSFIIILIVAKCFERFKNSRTVEGCMTGLKPAVVGLIGSAIISVLLTVFIPNGFSMGIFTDASFYVALAIFVICTVMAFKKVHPIIIICLAAVLGIVTGYAL